MRSMLTPQSTLNINIANVCDTIIYRGIIILQLGHAEEVQLDEQPNDTTISHYRPPLLLGLIKIIRRIKLKFRRAFIKFISFIKNRKIRSILKKISGEEIYAQMIINLLSNCYKNSIKSIKVSLNDNNSNLDLTIYDSDDNVIWSEDKNNDEIVKVATYMLEYWIYNVNKGVYNGKQ